MPRIEVITPAVGDGEPLVAYGTKVLCDGQELKEVKSCRMSWTPHDIVRCDLEVLPCTGSRFVADAEVFIDVIARPGYVVISEPQPDGTTVYRLEEELVRPAPLLVRVLAWFRG